MLTKGVAQTLGPVAHECQGGFWNGILIIRKTTWKNDPCICYNRLHIPSHTLGVNRLLSVRVIVFFIVFSPQIHAACPRCCSLYVWWSSLLSCQFYAPWCGHCRKLEPTYHQVYLTLRQQSSPVRVAKIDATRYSGVSSEFDVRGFPTIKL